MATHNIVNSKRTEMPAASSRCEFKQIVFREIGSAAPANGSSPVLTFGNIYVALCFMFLCFSPYHFQISIAFRELIPRDRMLERELFQPSFPRATTLPTLPRTSWPSNAVAIGIGMRRNLLSLQHFVSRRNDRCLQANHSLLRFHLFHFHES